MKNVIWLFKEQRSGSSVFAEKICHLLQLNYVFVENDYQNLSRPNRVSKILARTESESDKNSLLHTHLFEGIVNLYKYTNPIVFRCSRRNKFDQFLSWLAVKSSGWKFFHLSQGDVFNQNKIFDSLLERKIQVQRSDFNEFMHIQSINDRFWNFATKYPNQIVYYEDMVAGNIDIPLLNLYNIKFDSNVFIKNPESYKKNMFINYEEVKVWFDQVK